MAQCWGPGRRMHHASRDRQPAGRSGQSPTFESVPALRAGRMVRARGPATSEGAIVLDSLLPRQERSSQARNHGTTPPYGRELPPGRTRKGEVDSDSLFRVFRWIPWLISDPSGAAIGCCWTESAVRICADLGCRGNMPKTKALRDETKYRLLPPL